MVISKVLSVCLEVPCLQEQRSRDDRKQLRADCIKFSESATMEMPWLKAGTGHSKLVHLISQCRLQLRGALDLQMKIRPRHLKFIPYLQRRRGVVIQNGPEIITGTNVETNIISKVVSQIFVPSQCITHFGY